jgi:hypothetical protein
MSVWVKRFPTMSGYATIREIREFASAAVQTRLTRLALRDRPHLLPMHRLGRAPAGPVEPRFELSDLDAVFRLRRRGTHRHSRDPLENLAGPNRIADRSESPCDGFKQRVCVHARRVLDAFDVRHGDAAGEGWHPRIAAGFFAFCSPRTFGADFEILSKHGGCRRRAK